MSCDQGHVPSGPPLGLWFLVSRPPGSPNSDRTPGERDHPLTPCVPGPHLEPRPPDPDPLGSLHVHNPAPCHFPREVAPTTRSLSAFRTYRTISVSFLSPCSVDVCVCARCSAARSQEALGNHLLMKGRVEVVEPGMCGAGGACSLSRPRGNCRWPTGEIQGCSGAQKQGRAGTCCSPSQGHP